MNENSENIEWKHVYTIKEMTPIQGLEKGIPNFTPRPVGGRGSDFHDPRLINPKKYSLRYNPPKDWQGIKYNNHWFGLVHLLEQTHHHFNIHVDLHHHHAIDHHLHRHLRGAPCRRGWG